MLYAQGGSEAVRSVTPADQLEGVRPNPLNDAIALLTHLS